MANEQSLEWKVYDHDEQGKSADAKLGDFHFDLYWREGEGWRGFILVGNEEYPYHLANPWDIEGSESLEETCSQLVAVAVAHLDGMKKLLAPII